MIWFARPISLERWVVRKTSVQRCTLLLLLGAAFLMAGGMSNQLRASIAPSTLVRVAPGDEAAPATFAGKIVSQNGDRFILRDDANEVWYHLDDQAQAQKHFGKDVVVTGVLDGRSDMIHVRNIVEVKP
jgi:uncharacterized protein YdeI (BOF family)